MRPLAATFHLHGADVSLGGGGVLRGLNLEVQPGEHLALVGPSGSGKTTLLRVLAGGLPLRAGRLQALGQDVSQLEGSALRRFRARVGFIHQDHSLVPNVRVSQNVLSGQLGKRSFFQGLRMMSWPRRADVEAVHEGLTRVGIGDKLFQRTDTLSGGQQQRVALARALFQEPDVLLADEPVASVDPERARDILSLLIRVSEERGVSLIVSLHDIELARQFFPRTVGLREGRIAFDRPTAEVSAEELRLLYRIDPEPPEAHS